MIYDIIKDKKKYLLEWYDLPNGRTAISITECCNCKGEKDCDCLLETYDFKEVTEE